MDRFVYNGTDCCTTLELAESLYEDLADNPEATLAYEAMRSIQAAMCVVGWRGIKVDEVAAAKLRRQLEEENDRLASQLRGLAGRPLTGPKGSPVPDRLKAWFYDELGIRPIKSEGKVSTDRTAMGRIAQRKQPTKGTVPHGEKSARLNTAKEGAELVERMRELGKDLGVLRSRRPDGRMHTSFKLGPETFRAASSKDHRNNGTNLQNQKKELRSMYVADPGYEMFQADQERAESQTVAYLAGDEAYIRAHEEGNSHVAVCRSVFPEYDWTGDEVQDQKLAKEYTLVTPHYGEKPLYDLGKRTQHGLNYMLTPHGLARGMGISIDQAKRVSRRYFEAFPNIKEWHHYVIEQVKRHQTIHAPGGYKRQFFGRWWDEGTWKEAVAFLPQSLIAWTNHVAFVRCVRAESDLPLEVLGHGHDAVLGQARERIDLMPLLQTTWPVTDIHGTTRHMTIDWEVKWGRNWEEVS